MIGRAGIETSRNGSGMVASSPLLPRDSSSGSPSRGPHEATRQQRRASSRAGSRASHQRSTRRRTTRCIKSWMEFRDAYAEYRATGAGPVTKEWLRLLTANLLTESHINELMQDIPVY